MKRTGFRGGPRRRDGFTHPTAARVHIGSRAVLAVAQVAQVVGSFCERVTVHAAGGAGWRWSTTKWSNSKKSARPHFCHPPVVGRLVNANEHLFRLGRQIGYVAKREPIVCVYNIGLPYRQSPYVFVATS